MQASDAIATARNAMLNLLLFMGLNNNGTFDTITQKIVVVHLKQQFIIWQKRCLLSVKKCVSLI